ncbi:MAG: hypothetical protein WBL25_12065 [Anaerolineales bacterium]
MQDAIQAAQNFLIQSRISGSGWGYRSDAPQAFPEPTCYSLLALTDTSFSPTESIDWLSGLVNLNGQLYLPNDDSPNWGTSHLIITLSRLNLLPDVLQVSIDWLLEWKSQYIETTEVITLDVTLIGWPWISDTFSWVQPTSYAIFALKLVGLKKHDRVKEAEALLFDRMCQGGGWNFGNPIILNRSIDPSLSETAIALFALQDVSDAADEIDKGLTLLEEELPNYPTALALSLGILCLQLYDRPIERFVDLLLARQETDGSWRQMAWWTALGVLALQAGVGGENVFKL